MKIKITNLLLNKIIQQYHDSIKGGLSDKVSPNRFDRKQLAKGIETEVEHTSDLNMALEIAMDHLKEDANYYDKLQQAGL